MTIEFALEYIPRRMEELGYGKDYHLRLKYLMLQPLEKKVLPAFNQLILLVDIGSFVKVESQMGLMDWNYESGTEWQFEHQGEVNIENVADGVNYLQYIQVIPKMKVNAHHQ
jgi:hypothetical protein